MYCLSVSLSINILGPATVPSLFREFLPYYFGDQDGNYEIRGRVDNDNLTWKNIKTLETDMRFQNSMYINLQTLTENQTTIKVSIFCGNVDFQFRKYISDIKDHVDFYKHITNFIRSSNNNFLNFSTIELLDEIIFQSDKYINIISTDSFFDVIKEENFPDFEEEHRVFIEKYKKVERVRNFYIIDWLGDEDLSNERIFEAVATKRRVLFG